MYVPGNLHCIIPVKYKPQTGTDTRATEPADWSERRRWGKGILLIDR